MRSRCWAILLLGAATVVAGAGEDQPPTLYFSTQWGLLPSLLRQPGVHKELSLTSEQLAKLNEVTGQAEKAMSEVRRREGKLPPAERSGTLSKRVQERDEAYAAILDPGQVRRLSQIALQSQSYRAFREPKVQEALRLTAAQQERVSAIFWKASDDMPKPDGGADLDKMFAKVQQVRQRALEETLAVLTAEQKQTWKEMTGKPFEFKTEARKAPPGK